jgi:hypothetical protein
MAWVIGSACTDNPKPSGIEDDDGSSDLPGGTETRVLSAGGDTLTTTGGITLGIGPGALPGDTTVALIPVSVSDEDEQNIAGARMEPEGLILESPVVVRFPLPPDWDAEDTPLVYEFKGDDPSNAVESGAYALITGSPGAYFAEVLVSHFSGVVCARNCHAGTIRRVLEAFEARGCSRDSVLARVRSKYVGVDVPSDGCGARGVETVQAFLDTYFEDRGGFDAGTPVPASLIAELSGYVKSGRQVVLAFKPGAWGSRGGPHDFLPTAETEFAHTAALEVQGGVVQIRNTLATGNDQLIDALGGENVARYPFEQVNDFRELPQGVAVELALGLQAGDLSDKSRNPYGLEIYHPVEGQSYLGRAWSDPWTYLFSNGPWSGIPPRSIPWSAVRVYVERLDGPQSELCPEEGGEGTLDATVDIPGYTRSFVPDTVLATLGIYNDVPGYPGIIATTDAGFDPNAWADHDYLVVFLDKGLSAPGTLVFTNVGLDQGDAILTFTTPLIRDEGTTDNVAFSAASGTLVLESYGMEVGQRLKGTFTTNVVGERRTTPPGAEDPEYETLTGEIDGSFDAEILETGSGKKYLSLPRSRTR